MLPPLTRKGFLVAGAAVLALVAAFCGGRASVPECAPVVIDKTQEAHAAAEVQQAAAATASASQAVNTVRRRKKTVKKPDGTVVTTETDTATQAVAASSATAASSSAAKSTVEYRDRLVVQAAPAPKWGVYLLGGTKPAAPTETVLGGMLTRRLIGRAEGALLATVPPSGDLKQATVAIAVGARF